MSITDVLNTNLHDNCGLTKIEEGDILYFQPLKSGSERCTFSVVRSNIDGRVVFKGCYNDNKIIVDNYEQALLVISIATGLRFEKIDDNDNSVHKFTMKKPRRNRD